MTLNSNSVQPNIGNDSVLPKTSSKDGIDSVSDGSYGYGESNPIQLGRTPLNVKHSSLSSTMGVSSNSGAIHRSGNGNYIP
ncbi:hypothetical protein LSM04_002045 [Trypanosoma melophagium]|uniref:uncharacterized protein n=1 Tax=Trypanosoma melophagium TaxID=715481 RepID=UPI003519F497|nr:hypothetical protein LSM04_002045 [Trypanosoma melophagium]